VAESGSETTSEVLKIQACPQTPLVGACFARTFYIDTSISATNGLSTSYLLPTPLYNTINVQSSPQKIHSFLADIPILGERDFEPQGHVTDRVLGDPESDLGSLLPGRPTFSICRRVHAVIH